MLAEERAWQEAQREMSDEKNIQARGSTKCMREVYTQEIQGCIGVQRGDGGDEGAWGPGDDGGGREWA